MKLSNIVNTPLVTLTLIGSLIGASHADPRKPAISKKNTDPRIDKMVKQMKPTVIRKETALKNTKIAQNLTLSLRKEIARAPQAPEAVIMLQKKMESDKEYGLKITNLIRQKKGREVNLLLKQTVKSKLEVVYPEPDQVDPVLLQFRWTDRNGIVHVWPKNTMGCPKF